MKSRNSNTEPGQPCISKSGVGLGPFPGTCRKCRSVVRPGYLELREGVQPRLLRAPIEGPAPIVDEAAKIVDVRPVEPRLAGRGIGKTGARETLAQVRNIAVRNAQCERLRHRLLLRCWRLSRMEADSNVKRTGARKRPPPIGPATFPRRPGLTRCASDAMVARMQTHYNAFAGGDVGRIEALSDGIFAFAATVLVLDFHTPDPADIHSEAELLHALAASAHRLLPWLLSLLTLGIFWVAQQTQLSQLARSNRDLTWLHLVFLAIVTVLPFTTRLLADFFTYRTAFLIYWANIFAARRGRLHHLGLCRTGEAHSGRRADGVFERWSRSGSSSPSRFTRSARSSASSTCRSGSR